MALLLRPKYLLVYKKKKGRAQKTDGEKNVEKKKEKEEQKGMEL